MSPISTAHASATSMGKIKIHKQHSLLDRTAVKQMHSCLWCSRVASMKEVVPRNKTCQVAQSCLSKFFHGKILAMQSILVVVGLNLRQAQKITRWLSRAQISIAQRNEWSTVGFNPTNHNSYIQEALCHSNCGTSANKGCVARIWGSLRSQDPSFY